MTVTEKAVPAKKRALAASFGRRTYTRDYVRSLFDHIAPRYDFLNHLLSSGIDILWRRKAVAMLRPLNPKHILDVATGTGDLALEACRLHPRRVVGIDISREMLNRAKEKCARQELGSILSFQEAAAEELPFDKGVFDAATVAFGVRNFSNLSGGLREIARVLRPGGSVTILEFSRPRSSMVGRLYGFYAQRVLPVVGGSLSNKEAYEYLPNTIQEFPDGEEFAAILRSAGFDTIRIIPLSFGIVTIYHGYRRSENRKSAQS